MGLGGTGPRCTHSPPPTPSTGPGGPQHDGARGTEPGCALLGPPTKCSGLAELAPMKLGTRGSPLALAQARAVAARLRALGADVEVVPMRTEGDRLVDAHLAAVGGKRSEEHTSELQSLAYLVCRLLLEKKKNKSE